MKVVKKIVALVLTIGMFLPVSIVCTAASNSNPAVPSDASEGIVQVNTVAVDADGKKYVVYGGAGFLVGDTEGSEYVITCNHVVNPDGDIKSEALDFYGLNSGDAGEITYSTEVVVEGDVVLNANILTNSEDMDMAVLSLPQPIYTRVPLPILTSDTYEVADVPYKAGDKVYSYGYPAEITYESETQYYSTKDIKSAQGEIVDLIMFEGIQMIENNVNADFSVYGGPLVDENGFVIGLNLPVTDGNNWCALDSTKITKVLDGLGVGYAKVQAVPKEEKKSASEDGDSKGTPVQTETKEPIENGNSTKTDFSESIIMIVALAAVFVVAVVVLTIVMLLLNKKRKATSAVEKQSKYQGPSYDMLGTQTVVAGAAAKTVPDFASSQPAFSSDETTVLGADALNTGNEGETELLSEDMAQEEIKLGSLFRKRTSETIEITKSDFVIGKDKYNADYCIDNNKAISRQHAIITAGRNGAYIKDCDSTNGTWINGTKLESGRLVLLNNGDIIKLSNEEFEYQI